MGIIKVLDVKRRKAEQGLAEELHEKLLDAGWAPPGQAWRLRDALDHIRRTCHHSRTQTRRLRWISRRADLALKGEDFSLEATHEPPRAPSPAGLEKQLKQAQREIQALTDDLEEAQRIAHAAMDQRDALEEALNDLRAPSVALAETVENRDDIPIYKWAIRCARLVNQVKKAAREGAGPKIHQPEGGTNG